MEKEMRGGAGLIVYGYPYAPVSVKTGTSPGQTMNYP